VTNPANKKGDRAELEIAGILTDQLGIRVRRKLGAGRADDTGDRPDWHTEAACHGLTHLFFPEPGGNANQAKAVCRTCPVVDECADAGEGEHFGVWGGRSERQRKAERSRSWIVGVPTPIRPWRSEAGAA